MDFDEYEYLEKTVENAEAPREKEPLANGVRSGDRERSRSSKGRAEDGDRDAERGSRRSRSEDAGEPRDEERQRERSSLRHRSSSERRSRDGERGEKDRHRREHREERDREMERDRERDRERIRERDRELEKEWDRERERARRSRSRSERHYEEERERERARRSRSRSERHYEEERDRYYREKSRDRELRDRDRESRERERDGRHHKEKKEEAAEPEADPERDQRTVFAYQITLKADERDVYEFFSRAGKVRDVRLIMDRNTRRSKGVGYIEFYDVMSVPMAIALSGQNLLGQPVMVKPSEAEKNLVQSTSTTAGAAVMGPGVVRRLYVGNLHLNITEDQLRQVFEPFGPVELVQLPVDPETRQCKGYGFIQFARLEDARAALSLNGQLEIAGRTIKVSSVSEHVGMQDVGTNAGDFDDDEGGGLALNARSRALLMQKLDRSGITTSVASSLVSPVVSNPALPTASVLGAPPVVSPILQAAAPALVGLPGTVLPVGTAAVPQADTIGVPSECLLLKNMFDPSAETEPDFDLDIKEDVRDECSKFGAVKHIFVDKNSAGFVYLQFDNVTSAMGAQRALHGRWFAGKMISATFMLPQNYSAKFPGSG